MDNHNKSNLFIQIPDNLHYRLKIHCIKNRIKIKKFVGELIEKSLKVK